MPAEIKDQSISAIKTATLRLAAGGTLQIRLRPSNGSASLSSIDVFVLQTDASESLSNINRGRFALNGKLEAQLPVAKGRYHVWLYDPKYVITPRYFDVPISTNETRQLVFECHPKVPFSGRIVNRHDGKPVEKVFVTALVADPNQAAEAGSEFGPGWSRASATRTDADGRFRLDLPEERIKLAFEGESFDVEEPRLDLDIGPRTRTATIRLGIRRVPPAKGIVVDSNGTPVAGAIVRAAREFRFLTPVLTDEHGHFEIPLPWFPGASPPVSEGPILNLLAFDPIGAARQRCICPLIARRWPRRSRLCESRSSPQLRNPSSTRCRRPTKETTDRTIPRKSRRWSASPPRSWRARPGSTSIKRRSDSPIYEASTCCWISGRHGAARATATFLKSSSPAGSMPTGGSWSLECTTTRCRLS